MQPPLPLVLSNGSTFPLSSFGHVSTPRGLGNLPLPSFNCVSAQGEERTLSTRLVLFRHQGNPSSSFVWPRFDTRRQGFSPLVWPPILLSPRLAAFQHQEDWQPCSASHLAAFRHLKDVYPSFSLVWPHFDIRAAPCPSPFGRVSTSEGVSPHFDTPRTGNHSCPLVWPHFDQEKRQPSKVDTLEVPPSPLVSTAGGGVALLCNAF